MMEMRQQRGRGAWAALRRLRRGALFQIRVSRKVGRLRTRGARKVHRRVFWALTSIDPGKEMNLMCSKSGKTSVPGAS